MKNLQSIFNTVARHLLKQGRKAGRNEYCEDAETNEFRCRYRAAKGLKCAVGCLIPDSKYKPSMEGKGVRSPVVYRAAGLETEPARSLGVELQRLHDECPVDSWADGLKKIAYDYYLSAKVAGLAK